LRRDAGHQPKKAVERFVPFLADAAFEVIIENSLDVYADPSVMSSLAVILQNWTTGDLTAEQGREFAGLEASERGRRGARRGLCLPGLRGAVRPENGVLVIASASVWHTQVVSRSHAVTGSVSRWGRLSAAAAF
jgi:hypothetical protein